MIKRMLLLSILTCISTTSLLSGNIKEGNMKMGHDYYKKKAVQSAEESKQALQKHFNTLIQQLKENPPMSDKDHEEYILDAVEKNQKDWLNYQYSYCQIRTLLEIYPRDSRLFVQALNSCMAELNKKRISHLENMILELKK